MVLTETTIKPLQLSDLTQQINKAITDRFASSYFWVIADVSNHTFQPGYSRHFMDLVEKNEFTKTITAKVSAVAWGAGASRIQNFQKVTGQQFKSGIKVCLKVQVDFHATWGLKLVIIDVDPSYTIGQLELHRQATIQRLLKECASHIRQEGDRFITKNNSLNHATVIQRIAVISSSSSAGYADFMDALYKNKYGYKFRVNNYFTSVQGEANADAATKKVEEICASGIKFDAVVVIRGGGADTDFLLFDQFSLCSAVANLHIPVITGIGHLKNQSIVDLLAHTNTNAPTKAAEFIVAHNLAFETLLLAEQKKVVIKTQQILARHNQVLLGFNAQITGRARTLLTRHRVQQEQLRQQIFTIAKAVLHKQKLQLADVANKATNKPVLLLCKHRQDLKATKEKLTASTKNLFLQKQKDIEKYDTIWRLMSPVNVLRRGFAIIYRQGKIISAGNHLQTGEDVMIRMQDAQLHSTIINKQENNGNDTYDL